MIQDLHSHTYYSFCGKDDPEELVKTAIAGGVELFGICDHNYGIAHGRKSVFGSECDSLFEDYERTLTRYYDHIKLLKEKYADKIRLLCGVEVATVTSGNPRLLLPDTQDLSIFDYCLIEHIDCIGNSRVNEDLFAYAERFGCPVGIAHTDMFSFIEAIGEEPSRYFRRMAERGIFWELNVNYDTIHKFREHEYVKRFFESEEQQDIVRQSRVRLSVGFDCHAVEDYRPERVADACRKLESMNIPLAFE